MFARCIKVQAADAKHVGVISDVQIVAGTEFVHLSNNDQGFAKWTSGTWYCARPSEVNVHRQRQAISHTSYDRSVL